jgi:peptidyl-prolyl cis-trans isomerase SurA
MRNWYGHEQRGSWHLAASVLALALFGACACRAQGIQPTEPTPSANQQPVTEPSRPEATSHDVPVGKAGVPASAEGPVAKTNGQVAGIILLPELKPDMGQLTLPPLNDGTAAVVSEANKDHAPAELLDRVVAVINGDVILESDVREEERFAVFEPISVPGGRYTPLQAMQHLVSRTLIVQQMKDQQMAPPPSDEAVEKELDELRRHIPGCAQYACETDAGWRRFLAAQGFTESEIKARWKRRMQILKFIEVRFRSGIRIAPSEIADYYNKTLVPAFERRKTTPPPLAMVSKRIDEVLLQQRVTALLNDWLRSLRDTGSVAILDPAYASVGTSVTSHSGDVAGETTGGVE